MEDKLLKYFQRIMPLSKEEIEGIVETMTIREYKKGTVLLREGQISTEAYFVLDGCVRQFYVVDGEEKTSNFFTEEQWVINLNSFRLQQPSNHYLDCCIGCKRSEVRIFSPRRSIDAGFRVFWNPFFIPVYSLVYSRRYGLKIVLCVDKNFRISAA